jgi:hypothetical protein
MRLSPGRAIGSRAGKINSPGSGARTREERRGNYPSNGFARAEASLMKRSISAALRKATVCPEVTCSAIPHNRPASSENGSGTHTRST